MFCGLKISPLQTSGIRKKSWMVVGAEKRKRRLDIFAFALPTKNAISWCWAILKESLPGGDAVVKNFAAAH